MIKRANKPDTPADIQLRTCLVNRTSFIVVAGAGSGKTTSLIKALTFISNEHGRLLRQQGKRVACITYTTVAEEEIKNDIGHDPLFHVSTIHSFMWEIIRPFQQDIRRLVIKKIDSKLEELERERSPWKERTRQTTKDKNARNTEKYINLRAQISSVKMFKYETGSNYSKGILGHNDVLAFSVELIQNSSLLRTVIAQKYPYFFVDESQDTDPKIVDALKSVDRQIGDFCLGFFGDPMQKIYLQGVGAIALEDGWVRINKPENFRCSTDVLNVIKNIRRGGDDLEQEGGRRELINGNIEPVKGSAYLFVFDALDDKEERLNAVREFIAENNNDELWLSPPKISDLKVLVIEHRMAAKRLGFENLFSAFSDRSTESLKTGFKEGTCWPVLPFQRIIIPLVKAANSNQQYKVIEILRKHSPLLQKHTVADANAVDLLELLQVHVNQLKNLLNSATATVKDVLLYVWQEKIFLLDERILAKLNGDTSNIVSFVEDGDEEADQQDRINDVVERYFECPVQQMWGYQTYIDDESPYSTQHGIKGTEFSRVLVVLDDEEGNSPNYSYDKLFGLKELSDTDQGHIENGRDNTLARTRRLLYVCCSRSLQDLGVLLFASDVDEAVEALKGAEIFEDNCIKTINDITN